MSDFSSIDDKLTRFAAQRNGQIFSDCAMSYLAPLEKVEERRIFWVDGVIGKGIMIQPYFDSRKIIPSFWNFRNIAWLRDDKSYPNGVPHWNLSLLQKVPFEEIEKQIDTLLISSAQNLEAVKIADLKP